MSAHLPTWKERIRIALALLPALLALGLPAAVPAQGNPFFDASPPSPSPLSITGPSPRLQWLIDAQKVVREVLAEAVDRTAGGGAGALPLLALSFAYGLLHALGPGHRKIALAAYFLARPARVSDGVAAGTSVAFLHAVSAVAIVYGLYYLLRRSISAAFSSVSGVLELASYAAILLLGLVLLALAVRAWARELAGRRASREQEEAQAGGMSLAAIILSSGAVPCPGAALILIFCLSQELPGFGALAALAMSGGMAVVTVGVSLAAILGKRGLLTALPVGSLAGGLLHHGIETLGALLIVAFGLLMLVPYLPVFLG